MEKLQENAEKLVPSKYTYSLDLKEKALVMHLSLKDPEQIAQYLDIDLDVVKTWVSSNPWKKAKGALLKKTFGAIYSKKKPKIEAIVGMGLGLIEEGLSDLAVRMSEEGKQLSVHEMKMLSTIIQDFDKMIRLEEGKPTDIKKYSMKEAKKKIVKIMGDDPMGEFQEVEIDEPETVN